MNVVLSNKSKVTACVKINDGNWVEVLPFSNTSIEVNSTDCKISVRRNILSSTKIFRGEYTFQIIANYNFRNIYDNICLEINREKIKVEPGIYYERFFLNTNIYIPATETYSIYGEKYLKKKYNHSSLIDYFFIDPLFLGTKLLVVLSVIGIGLTISLGLKFAAIYFPLMYLFLVCISALSDFFGEFVATKVVNKILKTDTKSERKEFLKHFDSCYISKYYQNPMREAFNGKIETD